MRDEQVQVSVPIVVQEGAAGAPAPFFSCHPGLCRGVDEGSVPVVAIQDVLSPVGHEEVHEPVVVVVAGAHALSPAGARQAGFARHVGKAAISVVPVEVIGGLLSSRKAFQAGAVDEEQVQPPVPVKIDERHAAPGRLQDVLLARLPTKVVPSLEPGGASDIGETVGKSVTARPDLPPKEQQRRLQYPDAIQTVSHWLGTARLVWSSGFSLR